MINSNNDKNNKEFQSFPQSNMLQKQLFTPVEQTVKRQDKYREQFYNLKQKYQLKQQIRDQTRQLEKLKRIPLEKQKSLVKSARIKSTSNQRQKSKQKQRQKQRQRQLYSQLEQTQKQQKQLYKKLKLISLIKSDYNSLKKIHNSPQVFASHPSSNNSHCYPHQASSQMNGKYAQPSDCYIPYKYQRKIQSEMKINKNTQKEKQGKIGKKWNRFTNAKVNTEEILFQDNQNFSKRSKNIEQKYLQMQHHYHQQYSNRVRNNTEGNQSKSKNKYKNKNHEILSVCKIKMLQSAQKNKTPQKQKSTQKQISKQINPLKYYIKSDSICQCRCTCCQNVQQNCPCICILPSSFPYSYFSPIATPYLPPAQKIIQFSILKHNRSLTEQISNNREGIKCQKVNISEEKDGKGYQSERRVQKNEGMDRAEQKYQSAFITDECNILARKMLLNWKKQKQFQHKNKQAQSQLQLQLQLESGLQKTKLKSIPKSRLHFELKKSAQKSQIYNDCQNENQKESDRKQVILNFYRKKSNKSKTTQNGNEEDNKKDIEKIKAEKAQQKCICKCECKYKMKNGMALDGQFLSNKDYKLKEINSKDETKNDKEFENICKATLKGWTRYHGTFGQNETNNFY